MIRVVKLTGVKNFEVVKYKILYEGRNGKRVVNVVESVKLASQVNEKLCIFILQKVLGNGACFVLGSIF